MNKNQPAIKHAGDKVDKSNNMLALRVVSVAVASCFSASALAAGTGGQFVNGAGSITTSGNIQTIINSPNSIINWNSFSSGSNETIRFIQQNASSAVLNRVVGLDPTVLLGTLTSNGRVFIINPNGILFGATSVVDVNGLVASTLDISNADFIAGKLNFIDSGSAGSVVNQGSIRTKTGGSVYLIAPDINNTGIISSPQGQVVLAAGHSVQLVDAGTPELQVQVDAGGSAVNVGKIIAHSGDIGIYGALITQGGTLNANTAVAGKDGSIVLQASQDIDMVAGGITTASGGSGSNEGGQISIVADGTLNVAQGHEIHVDGGRTGGDAGSLEVSGKHDIVLQGEMTGVAVAGYKGGNLLIDPSDISFNTSGSSSFINAGPFVNATAGSGTLVINPTAFKTWADGAGWATVALTASDDITVNADIGTAANRFNHSLTMTAGDQLDVNANIFLATTKALDLNAGGDLNIAPAGAATLTLNAGSVKLAAGNNLTIGGSGIQAQTNIVATTNIAATADGALLIQAGNINAVNGDNINTSVSMTAGGNLALNGDEVSIYGGNVTAVANGAGAHTATGVANVNLKSGGNLTINADSRVAISAGAATATASNNNEAGGATNTAKADTSINITAGKLFTVAAGNASNTGSINMHAGDASASASKAGSGSGIASLTGNETATATANLNITAGTGITIAATDSNVSSAGSYAQVNLGGGAVMALAGQGTFGSGNKLTGNSTATATGNLTLKATAGNITLSASGGVNGGNVNVSHGPAYAAAMQMAMGSGNVITGNNTASAQNLTTLTAGGDISLTGNNVSLTGGSSSGSGAGAVAAQMGMGGSASSANVLNGMQKAIATGGIAVTAGGDFDMNANGGDAVISAGGAALATASQFGGSNSSGVRITTLGNNANATNTIAIKAGGDLSVAGNNVYINGSYANASALQSISSVGGDKLSGNQTAAATNTITLTAAGGISLAGNSGDVSIRANGAIGSYFGSFSGSSFHSTSTARITKAVAMQGGSFNGGNVLTGNMSAAANGGITLTAARDVSIQGSNVNIYNNAASASAAKYLNFAGSDTLTGTHTATAISNISINAGGSIAIRGLNNGNVDIGYRNSYSYSFTSGSLHTSGFTMSTDRGATARVSQFTTSSTGINKFSGNQAANAATAITLKAGAAGNVDIQGGNVSLQGADTSASATNHGAGFANTLLGNNTANATGTLSIAAGKNITVAATGGSLGIENNGSAEAAAYNSAFGSGNKVTGTNIASANNNVSLMAGGSVSLSATDDVHLEVNSDASAGAYNLAGGSGNVILGTNTAKANNTFTMTATTGGISIAATGGSGSINISGSWAEANAYASANGALNKVSGNQNASANNSVKLSAGTSITLNAKQAISISASSATGYAYNLASGESNLVSGNHSADGRSTVDLTAKGAISITAQNNSVGISAGNSADASAYNVIAGPGDKNTVTGNHSASALDSVTITGSSITITGVGVDASSGTGAQASAYNSIYNVIGGPSGSLHASSNKIVGTNKAVANNSVNLTATGAIKIDGKTGSADLSINDYGSGYASNVIRGGYKNSIVGGNAATGTVAINLKAGTTLSITGNSVNAKYYDGSAYAYNYIGASGSALKPNSITGNNTATGTTNINVIAGGAVALTATNGHVSISAQGGSPDAYAYNSAHGIKNVITGSNTVNGSNGVKITGTSLALSATNGVYVYGTHANAEAYNYADGSSNTILGGNKAISETKSDLIATAGNLTLNAGSGSVYVSNESYGYGLAYNMASGPKQKILGANAATGNNAITLSATGLVDIKGRNGVYLYVGSASASAYNRATGNSDAITGNNVAVGNNTLSIKGGTGINISASNNNVYISAENSASAYAYNYAGGNKDVLSGNHTATATVGLTLTGPSIAIKGDGVYMYGDSAYGTAYNRADGSNNVITGNNRAAGSINISLNATAGDLTVDGGSNSVYLSNSSYAYADAYNRATGTKNKITGNNTAAGDVAINVTATGRVRINGDNVYLYADQASGSAYNDAAGSSHIIVGNNQAIAHNTLTVKGGSGIDINGGSGSVYISANGSGTAHAYNYANGNKHSVTGNNVASGSAGLSLTAPSITVNTDNGIYIYGSSASGTAYNSAAGNSNKVIGTNKATGSVNIGLNATGDITLDGGNNSVYISGSESAEAYAYNYVSGNTNVITGGNTGIAENNINIIAGGALKVSGSDLTIRTYGASATASNYLSGNNNKVSGANTATATGNTILKAGKAVTLLARTGSVAIEANNYAEAFGTNSVNGNSNTVAGNQVAAATTNLSITGASVNVSADDNIYISGSYAEGTASNYVSGNNNIVAASNKATGINAINIAAAGDVSLAAGSDVNISIDSYMSAGAYNSVSGNQNKVTGNNSGSATISINVSAGGALSVDAGNNIYVSSSGAYAYAYNTAYNDSNTIIGNNVATATGKLTLKAGKGINLTAGSDVTFEIHNQYASPHAINAIYGGKGNTITGGNTASGTNTMTVSGTSITVTADDGIRLYEYYSEATASNYISGGTTLKRNAIVGNNTATASEQIVFTTPGNLNLMAGGTLDISGSYGSTRAQNSIGNNGSFAKITGNNNASTSMGISLSAGGNIALTGDSVYIAVPGAYETTGSNVIRNHSGNVITGNNTAANNNFINIKANGGVEITATNGNVTFSQYYSPSAYASNRITGGSGNTITGTNTASAASTVSIIGSSIAVDASANIDIQGTSADAYAFNRSTQGSAAKLNVISGANKATAVASISLATAGSLNLTAGGEVSIDGYSSANAYAYNSGTGYTKITGNNTANAENTITLKAGGDLTITANSGTVSIDNGSGSGTAYNVAYNWKNVISGNNTASGTAAINLSAGGNLTLAGGRVNVSNNSSPDAVAYNDAGGNSNAVTGNNTAKAVSSIALAAGKAITISADLAHAATTYSGHSWSAADSKVEIFNTGEAEAYGYNAVSGDLNKLTGVQNARTDNTLSLTAGTGISVSGVGGVIVDNGSAAGGAYNYLSGNSNVITGGNIANATQSMAIKTTTGNLSLTATSGTVSANASSGADANAYNYVSGDKNTVTGTQVANASNNVTLTAAGGAITLDGDNVYVYGASATANAYNSGSGSLNKLSGNHIAKATNGIAFTAAKDITLKADKTAGSVYISGGGAADAEAYNYAGGSNSALTATAVTGNNIATANNTVSFNTVGNIKVSAHTVSIYGTSATGSAYNEQAADFNKITGNNVATGTAAVNFTAGKAISMAALGGNLSISANNSAEAAAYNKVDGGSHNTTTGANTANASNNIALKAGTGVALSAGNNVDIHAYYAQANASLDVASGDSNVMTGNNSATAGDAITITAGTGGVAISASGGDVMISAGDNADANAKHIAGNSFTNSSGTYYSYANNNTLSGAATAKATNNITLTTSGDIAISGGNIKVYGYSASASAMNEVIGSASGLGNKLIGNNAATGTTSIALNATGNIALTGTGDVNVDAVNGVYAYAIHSANGSGNAMGANAANAANTVSVKAGKSINISGNTNVYVAAEGGTASAAASSGYSNTRGANVAITDGSVSITAGTDLTLAAASGDVTLYGIEGQTANAVAAGNGKNTATAIGNTSLKAGANVDISGDNVYVYGGYYAAVASASGSAAVAANTANASGNLDITGANVSISANAGNVSIYGSSGASAYALGSGVNIATATGNNAITATGTLNVFANGGDVFVAAAEYSNSHLASASAATGGKATAAANSNVTLKGSSVNVVTSGDITLGGAGNSSISAVTAGAGGTEKATSTGDVLIQAGVLNLTADNIYIEGGSATMSGAAAKAEASTLVFANRGSITTYTGDLNVTAGVGDYSVAGIASVGAMTLNIADNVNITGGSSLPYKVVIGTYTRNMTDSTWRYGTGSGVSTGPTVAGVVSPGLGVGNYTTFGVTGDYTTTVSPTDPVAFIQIK